MRKEFNVARNFAGRVGAIAGAGVIAATMWVGLGGSMGAAPRAPFAPEAISCLPTCEIDGRHFVVAGEDNTTLGAQTITIGLVFNTGVSGEPNGNFDLFDGDPNADNWDVPFDTPGPDPAAPHLIIELIADPNSNGGIGNTPITIWTGDFPVTNNGWNGVTFPHDPAADDLTGNHVYAVRITPLNPSVDKGWNAFKIRANGTVTLISDQVVGFIASMGLNDFDTIYPDPPGFPTSVYDGTWSFKTRLPGDLDEVTVFDGDMDFGTHLFTDPPCEYKDTDDPDSVFPDTDGIAPDNTGIPPFAIPADPLVPPVASPEGVATGGDPCGDGTFATGQPADDNLGGAFRRMPIFTGVPGGIAFQIVAPDGQIFLNQNPSGNREWEQFRIQKVDNASEIPGGILCPDGGFAEGLDGYPASDCRTTTLPGGVWDVQLDGMDMQNLNFWFFSFKVEPIDEECTQENPCGVVAPTNQTCLNFASGEIATEYVMTYNQKQNPPKIGNVAPGVIFFFTLVTITEADLQPLSVSQSIEGGTPALKLHNNDARVYTANCTRVPTTATQDPDTGEVTFGTLPAGTYILQLKYQPKSLVGSPVPVPTPGEYTFQAELGGVLVIGTENDQPLLLQKK